METINEVKHTSGPWDIDNLYIRSKATGEYIADVLDGTDFPSYETAVENARLIAASPELLAALEHTLVALEAAQKLHPAWKYTDARNAAKKAIRKAKGGLK